jgi:hypothetical protein
MEVIWEGESGDTAETAFRLIMDDDGRIAFQHRSLDSEWTDVDEVPVRIQSAV